MKYKDEVLAAMDNEIRILGNKDEQVSTIYFGGGTPSLLSVSELFALLKEIQASFNIAPGAEITIEANPDDIRSENLKSWRVLGINRLSIGIQSFFDEDLRWMNRAHNSRQAINCINEVRAAGFDNFSIDLIYGSPSTSDEQWKKNIETAIDLGIPHISAYALTVEKGTALDNMIKTKKSRPVLHEKQALQFLLLMDWMEKAGYEHYEISNFARPGQRSRHNSNYWNGSTYTGIGPSAHSYDGKSRKWNVANNAVYTKQVLAGVLPVETETLTATQRLNEYIMTSVRTIEGIDISRVEKEFGQRSMLQFLEIVRKYTDDQKCIIRDNRLQLTSEGKLFADGIAADLFFD